MMKKGIGFVGVAVAAGLLMAFLVLRDEPVDMSGESEDETRVIDVSEDPTADDPETTEVVASESEEAISGAGSTDYREWLNSLTPTEFEQLEDWLENHGYFGGLRSERGMQAQHFGDYGSYSDESLRQLADNANDAKAQLILGWRLSEEGEHEAARPYLEQAAVNGYTSPLRRLREDHGRKALDDDLPQAERREHYEKSLAWANVAARRQSPMAEFEQKLFDIAREHGFRDHLPEADPESVERLTEEFYRELETRRQQRDLGPFDNSRPEIGDEFEHHLQSELDSFRERIAAAEREAEQADR